MNPSSLFSTIAQHPADRDPPPRQHLIVAIKGDKVVRTTQIRNSSMETLLFLSSNLIDVFDEIRRLSEG